VPSISYNKVSASRFVQSQTPNQETLKRMEDLINAINSITLKRIEDLINAVNETTLGRMEEEIKAIKLKVGA
jgi:hypothetical protein